MKKQIISYDVFLLNALLSYKNPISETETELIMNSINNSSLSLEIEGPKKEISSLIMFEGRNYRLLGKDEPKASAFINERLTSLFKKLNEANEIKLQLKNK